MSKYKGNILSSSPPVMDGVKYTGQASGRWSPQEYIAALSENKWVKALSFPDAPTNVSAVGGDTYIDVSFSAPTDTGGVAITSYEAVVSPSNIANTGNTSPIRVSGLTNGTAYTVNIHAINSQGTGTNATITGITPAGVLYQLSYPVTFGTPRNTTYSGTSAYANSTVPTFTGGNGPTKAELQTYYNTNSTQLAALLASTTDTYFEVPYNGVQVWTVPATRTYTFEVAGAPSGYNQNVTYGYPAKITASFNLTKGDIIWIIVGQRGTNRGSGNIADPGNGGFTLVAKGSDISNIANLTTCLICAGAGATSGTSPTNANYTVQSLTSYNIVKGSAGVLKASTYQFNQGYYDQWGYFAGYYYYNSSGGFPIGGANGSTGNTNYIDCYVDSSATNVTKTVMATLQAGYVTVT